MNKNYYLISPKTDFLLIGGAALITYFLVLLINIPKSFDVVFWMFVLAFFVNSPHFIISYEIFYSSVGEKILKKKADILPLAKRLLQQVDYSSAHPIRLLGLSVSNASSEEAKKEDNLNSSRKPEYRELELEFEEWES